MKPQNQPEMVDMSRAKLNLLRTAIVAACLLTLFFFSDPIGFRSSMSNIDDSSTGPVTHIVMLQFYRDTEPAAVNEVRPHHLY